MTIAIQATEGVLTAEGKRRVVAGVSNAQLEAVRGGDSIRDLFAIKFDGLRDLFKPFWRRETKFFADGELFL